MTKLFVDLFCIEEFHWPPNQLKATSERLLRPFNSALFSYVLILIKNVHPREDKQIN